MIFLESCTNALTNTASTDLFNDTSSGHLSLTVSVNSCVFVEKIRLTDDMLSNKNLVT